MAYTKTSTPIVYYGGKTSILNHILPLIPEHEVYTEVFFGGGTVFFAKKPAKNETINDKLDLVVNFYKVLQHNRLFPKLQKLIKATTLSRYDHNKSWELIKQHKKQPVKLPNVELAWAFWVNINLSYSKKMGAGLQYSNYQGSAPAHQLVRRKKLIETNDFNRRIESTIIENVDALKVLRSRNVKKAFHYVDPPYPNTDQGHYKGYTWEDYRDLLTFLATECKGQFLLSSYNSEMLDEYIQTYGWFKTEITHRIQAPRKSGPAKVEVLVRNYASPCNTLQLWNH